MSNRPKIDSEAVLAVAGDILKRMLPCCERIAIVGSLRRLKAEVGDAEILYIPKVEMGGLFKDEPCNMATRCIESMLSAGLLRKRMSINDRTAWGPLNKLAVHVPTGIPVDLFATTEEHWWNSLFVRTGPAELNARIGALAIGQGCKFHAYGGGFSRGETYCHTHSERDVFAFVGIPWREPHER